MNTKLTVLILVILILVAGTAMVFINRHEELSSRSIENIYERQVEFLISTLQTDVSVKERGGEIFNIIPEKKRVSNGTLIKTSSTGRAIVEKGDAVVTVVDRNSEIKIEEDNNTEKTSLSLISGNVWTRVEKTLEKGEFYEIKTQNAVATVRGTSFGTSLQENTTTIIVADGKVSVAALGKNGTLVETSEGIVSAGQKAVVFEEKIVVTETTPKDTESEWYQFNNPPQEERPAETIQNKNLLPASPLLLNPPEATEEKTKTETKNTDPKITVIEPPQVTIIRGQSSPEVAIKGENLLGVLSVFIGNTPSPNLFGRSDTEIRISVPVELQAGIYDVSLLNTSGKLLTTKEALTIEVFVPESEQKQEERKAAPTQGIPPQ